MASEFVSIYGDDYNTDGTCIRDYIHNRPCKSTYTSTDYLIGGGQRCV